MTGNELLRKGSSRKFWAYIGASLAAIGLFLQGQIDALALLAALVVASGTYEIGEGLADSARGHGSPP